MNETLKIATDIVKGWLASKHCTTSLTVKEQLLLTGLIAEKLREQYKAGMLRSRSIVELERICEFDPRLATPHDEVLSKLSRAIHAEAEKGE